MKSKTRIDTRIKQLADIDNDAELKNLYKVVKQYAKSQRMFMSLALKQVFEEFCINHGLIKK